MNENNIEWTKLAEVESFNENPEQLLKVKRDDILVIKNNDGFYAINNRYPHLGLALNLGGCNHQEKPFIVNFIPVIFSYDTGEVKAWLNVKGFEKFMTWLFTKMDPDAKKMMSMEPKPVETFPTKVEDDHVWVGINNSI